MTVSLRHTAGSAACTTQVASAACVDLTHPCVAPASTHRVCPQLSGRPPSSQKKAVTLARCVPSQSADVQVWQDGLTPHKQVQNASHHGRACVGIHLQAVQLQRPSMSTRLACRGKAARTAANKARPWAVPRAISLMKMCQLWVASAWSTFHTLACTTGLAIASAG